MLTVFWAATGLVLGSFPFSYWIGRIFLRKDIRQFGDGAPGATNVARAGNKALYIIAVLLDAFKGSVPVWLAQLLSGITGWELAVVAVCPVLGHAFTPFLRFKGGMGVATTFGVWLALLGWLGPIVLGVCIGIMFIFQKNWVWSTIGGMLGFLIFVLVMQFPFFLIGAGLIHTVILFIKRYTYFKSWPEPQPWLGRLVRKSS